MASSSSLRKLPPEVARELLRHVSPAPSSKNVKSSILPQYQKGGQSTRASATPEDQRRKNIGWVLAGTLALTGTAASLPLLAHYCIGNLSAKDGPLTAAQNRRGAFNNSGSRDVGRDPNWDKGQYMKDSGYLAILQEEDKKPLPAQYYAVDPQTMQKHEEKLKAFALGQAKNDK